MRIVREHINEKFEEQSDPIEDMGIGKLNFPSINAAANYLVDILPSFHPGVPLSEYLDLEEYGGAYINDKLWRKIWMFYLEHIFINNLTHLEFIRRYPKEDYNIALSLRKAIIQRIKKNRVH